MQYQLYLSTRTTFSKQSMLLGLSLTALFLSGCQSTTSTIAPQTSTVISSGEQAKSRLADALYRGLRQNQDWVAEHQLYLLDNDKKTKAEQVNAADGGILACQSTHDDALVAQLKQDNLDNYATVATLSAQARIPYERIKTTYLQCYDRAIQQAEPAKLMELPNDDIGKTTDDKTNENTDSATPVIPTDAHNTVTDPVETLTEPLALFGFSTGQINSLNNFVTKSGKVTTTGVYRPLSGLLALQFDAGFENKNLSYHYRLPVVANWHTQALYVKPDVIMPSIALYLDNKMGMAWQSQWYKFNQQAQLPTGLTTKQWLRAIQDSLQDLPASQFSQLNQAQFIAAIANDPTTNLSSAVQHQRLQRLAKNSTIIHWQQSAKQQDNWYQDIVERFIQHMDNEMATHYVEQTAYQQAWQRYRETLSQGLESRLINEPASDKRLTGKSLYIVLSGNDLAQIWASFTAIYSQQPIQVNTWVNFQPDNRALPLANQPQTLLKLASTIRDGKATNQANATSNGKGQANVIDGRAEIKRLAGLDSSRRLFGRESVWLQWLDQLVNKTTENTK